eukprot:CCRYP_011964-RA/>CCRYP_011964-RA protein AED:0.37 eAED:0.38 QI:0/0.5/0.33/1/0/0/3/1658/126
MYLFLRIVKDLGKQQFLRETPKFSQMFQSLSPINAPVPLALSSVAIIPFLYPSIASAVSDLADDVELAELPPVYVPILFAIAVLGGVGVLTASLGDVMDEEASLGLQSGARAKKERERSRSSYFKK